MKLASLIRRPIALLVVSGLTGCANAAGGNLTSTPAAFTDPFAYCAAVSTIDAPDARYTGPQVPDAVVNGLRKALHASSDLPSDVLARGTSWRCMDGRVYACFVGANLPCESKANTDRTPTQPERDYCAQNPNSDFIPAVVTGRETVYEWRCVNGEPQIARQLAQPDARGFISDIWYAISPN